MRDQAGFLFDIRPIELSGKLRKKVDDEALERLARLRVLLSEISDWSVDPLEATLSGFCADEGIGMGKIGPALRAALTGGAPSPDLSVVLYWLGQDETLARINDQITKAA